MQEQAKAVGRRIVQARLENGGMQQKELAERLGVTPRSVQSYESGVVVPWRQMEDLAKILERPVSWLLHGIEDEPPHGVVEALLKENLQVSKEILRLLKERQ